MGTPSLIHEKVAQAVGILREMDIDCWITFVRETSINGDPALDLILGTDLTWHSALIITSSGRRVAIVGKYDRKTVEDVGAYDEVIDYVEGIRQPLVEVMRRMAPRHVAINYSQGSEICDGLTHGMFLTMMELLREAGLGERVMSAEAIMSALRQRKSQVEIRFLKEAVDAAEEIFRRTRGYIRPGRTEKEIAAFMAGEVERQGLGLAWDRATCPSVFTGPDTAAAHYGPTDRAVERGHVLNIDFGVRCQGYVSDLQRTFYVLAGGERVPPEPVRRGFETITTAVESARKAMKPGVRGIEIDAIARGVVTAGGYEEFPHALGHQVGRFAHDGTALLGPSWEKYANKPYQPLETGMVFTIEPRLTVEGYGVVTIEEMVVIRDDGAEYLSQPQKELLVIRS